jgi:hypothetical protein
MVLVGEGEYFRENKKIKYIIVFLFESVNSLISLANSLVLISPAEALLQTKAKLVLPRASNIGCCQLDVLCATSLTIGER